MQDGGIISFLDRRPKTKSSGIVKRKTPSSSLANYDIKFLFAWYRNRFKSSGTLISAKFTSLSHFRSGTNASSSPLLVIVLHDFEQLDPHVMQDIFYVCR